MPTEVGPAAGEEGSRSLGAPIGPGASVVLVRTEPPATETVVDEHVCLYARRTREVLVLNQSAGAIWAATDRSRAVQEVAAEVAAAFGLCVADVIDDVRSTVDRFIAAGLLTEVAEA